MSAAAPPLCPACGASHVAGDRFCADCGARLGGAPAPACPNCGGAGFDADGFCTDCGARSRGIAAGLQVLGPAWPPSPTPAGSTARTRMPSS